MAGNRLVDKPLSAMHLTPAEFRVMYLRVLCHFSVIECARLLDRSPQTVDYHWDSVRRKLRLGPKPQAALREMMLADRFAG